MVRHNKKKMPIDTALERLRNFAQHVMSIKRVKRIAEINLKTHIIDALFLHQQTDKTDNIFGCSFDSNALL